MRIQSASILLFILLMLQSLGVAASSAPRDPGTHFFQATLGDFTEELERANDEGKEGVLIFFEMDECPFCHRMKTTVLNQPAVQDYFRKHFLIFSVDIEGDLDIVNFHGEEMTEKNFAFKEQRVRATPVFAFFNLQGERVARYTGATSGVDELMLLGQYVVDKQYESMPFSKYKRMQK